MQQIYLDFARIDTIKLLLLSLSSNSPRFNFSA